MELLRKLETTIHGWMKNLPHLPKGAQKWLGDNVWWIVLIVTILSGLGLLFAIIGLFALVALFGAVSADYYVYGAGPSAWAVTTSVISLLFSVAGLALYAMAIKPLKAKSAKGWNLLFLAWAVYAVAVVVNSILSFNPFSLIFGLLFGAVFAAISAYFLFEIHGEFHRAAKEAKTATVAKKTTKK